MHPLHLTKVAVGCGDPDMLRERLDGRAEGGRSWIETRYRPTRHGELIGGSLYWIIKHRLVARSEIMAFEETAEGRCRIVVGAGLVPVRVRFKRVHQGWRYLAGDDAPGDLDGGHEGAALLPPHLLSELSALALI